MTCPPRDANLSEWLTKQTQSENVGRTRAGPVYPLLKSNNHHVVTCCTRSHQFHQILLAVRRPTELCSLAPGSFVGITTKLSSSRRLDLTIMKQMSSFPTIKRRAFQYYLAQVQPRLSFFLNAIPEYAPNHNAVITQRSDLSQECKSSETRTMDMFMSEIYSQYMV